ncbi:MAG: type II toxin-antitoxin system VapC family toxin [Nocardiopsaceae bacterium]|jgi:predicted nucleic acid-binding protein|nr:type II toxin-antitoxin system VapC family toxin [Nocardiopsaceae bacterium]
MQTSDDDPDLLVDSSVAIALTVSDHPGHHETSAAVRGRRLGLAGHAAFETFSVLTRLPTPLRRKPGVIGEIIRRNFPASRFLSADATATLLARLPQLAIAGGAVYDALVAMAAVEHGLTLATRDRRAADTYRALGTTIEIIG